MKLEKLVEELEQIALEHARYAGEIAEFTHKLRVECCYPGADSEYAKNLAAVYAAYQKDRLVALYSGLSEKEMTILENIKSKE